ncbi:YpoC family protein [Neobacillus soli]|uniref:YpoC family protein n=1 Tax=Neobacillus soli TaxID=220688 RepID=UPI0008260125|nr:hypothetical protein [Neobacillus soli]
MDNKAESITDILEEWVELKGQLEELFRARDLKNVSEMMKTGITLFIQFLSWSNEKQALLDDPKTFNQLEFKPVNLDERLLFINSRPNLYHSFRQLSELMIEQEKLFAKRNIIKKASKPNG